MAKILFRGLAQYGGALQQLELTYAGNNDVLKKAARAGADPVADEIRKRLRNLPEDEYRRLADGEIFTGLPPGQKKDLGDSLGITPPDRDRNGFVHVKVGFDGYGSFPTNAYPDGVPNALLARSVESGSSVRAKTPFVRPAVTATRKKAVEEMGKVIDAGLKRIFEE